MMYVLVTARVRYSNGYTAVENFVVSIEKFHRFERDVRIKSNGALSVLEVIKVCPYGN